MAFSQTNATTSGTREGFPILIPVSNTGDASNRVLQLQSLYPYAFHVYNSMGGQYIITFLTPDGFGVKTASVDLSPYIAAYPAFVSIEMVDAASLRSLNTQQVTLVGGDIFKVELIFQTSFPVSQGYSMYGVDGAHVLLRNKDLNKQINETGDVHYLPQG